ncbi:septal ring lytic transglycosylase RlpA family protein [Ancylothrix sp. C2]|uniref:septal ring lytic transglycosylase RlpA family protein n=1 Tax=Ancylothrix sp. D3o TaxID=2953691 RepID=UPI0021BA8311|nr:septal ring lytic transglycosylase RlpA family protein [Ancylothrix sp. D3o]MCT7950226.1 septal ring lytic transglycosylase RlpA family protein [Ancylothrix sp. D3o]
MKHKLWSSLTAAMLITAIGQIPATHAETNQTENQTKEAKTPQTEKPNNPQAANSTTTEKPVKTALNSQNPTEKAEIAKIHSHILTGRQAATLYIRNIPVLTFLGNSLNKSQSITPPGKRQIIYGLQNTDSATKASNTGTNNPKGENQAYQSQSDDPVRRASEIAAEINKISRQNLDLNSISVIPEKGDTYLIKINNQNLVAIDSATILPDTTLNRAEDALQATNRLRRLLADAPPISEIPGRPRQQTAVNPYQTNTNQVSYSVQQPSTNTQVLSRISGWASWYGPGFHGNTSASGEIFNQNDLTAAHKELPFGTFVRVTNLDNGLSVIVRINDRGPYVGDRIIDLSAGAAQAIGMMGSGVAPVSVEILGTQNSLALPNR